MLLDQAMHHVPNFYENSQEPLSLVSHIPQMCVYVFVCCQILYYKR